MMSKGVEAEVEALCASGKIEQAAELLVSEGNVEKAAELYASIWQYRKAVEFAEQASQWVAAYRYALVGSLDVERERLLELLAEKPADAEQAAKVAKRLGAVADAARLNRGIGELELAAELYQELGAYDEAARLKERVGASREAGLLYEKALEVDPSDVASALSLAKILAHFGRLKDAVFYLQQAEASNADPKEVLTWLIACFEALGWKVAARERLLDLVSLKLAAPDQSVEGVLLERFGNKAGLRAQKSMLGEELLAGRYRLEGLLGAGVTGRVFRGHDCIYERPVAIKVLSIPEGRLGRDAFRRFHREAMIASALDHPAVVQTYDYNSSGPFLVMELMEGGSLEEHLVDGSLTCAQLGRVAEAVLEGLSEVHRRGIVHRDLKPANILLGPDGGAKLTDFGVSHLLDLGATVTGALFGTLGYMAPEQVEATTHPTPTTDLYAFGVILFRMLSGEMPFELGELFSPREHREPPQISSRDPSLCPYDELCRGLLQRDPARRPASAMVVLEQLRQIGWPQELAWLRAKTHGTPGEVSESTPASTDPREGRYRVERSKMVPRRLAWDGLLQRQVELRAHSEAAAEVFHRFAQISSPSLQALYGFDEAAGDWILEWPRGKRLSVLALTPAVRGRVLKSLGPLLEEIQRLGLTHGAVVAEQIWVSSTRVVLLLPERLPAEPARGDHDREMLEQVLAALP